MENNNPRQAKFLAIDIAILGLYNRVTTKEKGGILSMHHLEEYLNKDFEQARKLLQQFYPEIAQKSKQ